MSLDQLFQRMQTGGVKELNLIVKADVQGSGEVLSETLRKLSTSEVKVNVIHTSVGAVSTNDVMLATASDAIVIGFNVRPERNASELADKEGVDIRMYTVIYNLVDEMKLAMTACSTRNPGSVPGPRPGARHLQGSQGRHDRRLHGHRRNHPAHGSIRLLRDNRVILEGKIASLRHFKNDVAEVRQGFECGIGIDKFQDVKVGDVIEAFKIEQLAAALA